MTELDIIFMILGNLISFWAGYRLGLHIAVMRMLATILKDPKTIQKAIEEYGRAVRAAEAEPGPTEAARKVRVEQVGQEVYIYALDNDEFLGQGPCLTTALERVGQRFPNQRFEGWVDPEQAKGLADKH